MKGLPKVFIGSASETLSFAEALELQLKDDADIGVWDQSFRPSYHTLEELANKASEMHFAVFILG